MSEETKLATISKVIISDTVAFPIPMKEEDGTAITNVITTLTPVKIVMANGAIFGLPILGQFAPVTKEGVMAIYEAQPEVFTKIEQ